MLASIHEVIAPSNCHVDQLFTWHSGIGKTTPAFNLFPSRMERMAWDFKVKLALNASDHFEFSRAVTNSELIGDLGAEKTFVGKYMSTSIVARDMLSITKAYG